VSVSASELVAAHHRWLRAQLVDSNRHNKS
jgi:hypothetical protein